jgi:serine/threonine protein kinase
MDTGSLIGGRYRIGAVLGQGGMAEVRAGHDSRLDRAVAIKILLPEMAAQRGLRARFNSEARLAARLVHPHVVSVFDVGEDSGVPYIVMERLSGLTLRDRIAQAPLSEEAGWALALQLLAALAAAHNAGIVHRDVKPGNVLVGPRGQWKLGDFGIGKLMDPNVTQTLTSLLIGTPAYLAPERIAGRTATPASDIYSLGVLLYEALAGRKPSTTQISGGRVRATSGVGPDSASARLATLRPDVDRVLADAVDRCLSPDPAGRFASAEEMAQVLEGEPPATAETPTVLHAAPAVRTQVLPRGTREIPRAAMAWLASFRRRPVLGVAMVLAVIGLTAGAIATNGDPGSGQGRPPSTPISNPSSPPTTVAPVQPTSPSTPPAGPPAPSGGPHHGRGHGNGKDSQD